jgi:hypothetical protein
VSHAPRSHEATGVQADPPFRRRGAWDGLGAQGFETLATMRSSSVPLRCALLIVYKVP